MSYIESLKEIYESIAPEMEYCIFAPDLDEDKWESGLNKLAPQEEPISVLCIGNAKVKGLLSISLCIARPFVWVLLQSARVLYRLPNK